jgi:AcrR family transcriptional regulator
MTSAATELDGRRARRGRNREAVVDALLALFREGDLSPSVATVAERSGVSLRSVFRYFDDLDEMGRIAIARHTETVRHLFPLPRIGEGTRAERIRRIADHRVTLYDAVAPIVRATIIRAPFQPVIAAGLKERRDFLRGQVERQFAAEFAAVAEPNRFALIAGADALTSFETLELWHRDRAMSLTKCNSVMRAALDELLPN